jgi:cell division protein FtsQ
MDIFAVLKRQSALQYMLLCVAGVVILWVLAIRWQYHRLISRVSVVGTNLLRQQEILDLVKLPASRAMRDINTAEIERRIEKHPFVKTVSIFLGTSDALTVTIEERKPIAFVASKGRQYYVDAEGHLLPYRLTETVLDLPVISGLGRSGIDSAGIAMSIAMMLTLQKQDAHLYRALSEIDIRSSGEMILHFTETPAPIRFGTEEETQQKIGRISAFLHHAEQTHTKLKQVEYVDVRWENQIVMHLSAAE